VSGCDPADFTLATMPRRFAEVGDRHAGIDAAVGSLEALLELSAPVAVGGGLVWAIAHVLGRPKAADLLIECETEMRKCTWPSPRETITSSVVILVVMLFFTAVLAGMDLVLNYVMSKQVFG
jgi:preprotein translocase SecE subunit